MGYPVNTGRKLDVHDKYNKKQFNKNNFEDQKQPSEVLWGALCWSLFLTTLLKRDSNAAAFSCEICEILKSTYFEKNLQTTASERLTKFIGRKFKVHIPIKFCRIMCHSTKNVFR